MKKRVHIFYSGAVQGVGFRFTAEAEAGTFGISGWVKNLSDGRVELVAEGQEQAVEGFLSAMRAKMNRFIRDEKIDQQPVANELDGFTIRF